MMTTQWDMTAKELLGLAKEFNSEQMQLKLNVKGKAVAALVVLNGEDTQYYLDAIEKAEQELEAAQPERKQR
jgi:hypothetical protein